MDIYSFQMDEIDFLLEYFRTQNKIYENGCVPFRDIVELVTNANNLTIRESPF